MLKYIISIPERVVRTLSILSGTFLRDAGNLTFPDIIKNTKIYELFVVRTTHYMIDNLGGLKEVDKRVVPQNYVLKKAAGNFLEIISITAIGLSPLWVFLIISDASSAGRKYLKEVERELMRKGVITKRDHLQKADQLFELFEQLNSKMADAVDTPPISKKEFRERYQKMKTSFEKQDVSKEEINRRAKELFDSIERVSKKEKIPMLEVSGLVVLKIAGEGGRITKRMIQYNIASILRHYKDIVNEIRITGYYASVRDVAAKYDELSKTYKDRGRGTITEKLLKKYV